MYIKHVNSDFVWLLISKSQITLTVHIWKALNTDGLDEFSSKADRIELMLDF